MLEKSQLQNMDPSLSLYNYMKIYETIIAHFKVNWSRGWFKSHYCFVGNIINVRDRNQLEKKFYSLFSILPHFCIHLFSIML